MGQTRQRPHRAAASRSQELGGERAHGPAIANDKDNNEMKTKGNAGTSWHILTSSARLQRERYTAWSPRQAQLSLLWPRTRALLCC